VRLRSLRIGSAGRFFEGGHPGDVAALLDRNVVLAIEDVANDEDKTMLIGNGHTPAPLQRDGPPDSPRVSCCEHRGTTGHACGRLPNAYSCRNTHDYSKHWAHSRRSWSAVTQHGRRY